LTHKLGRKLKGQGYYEEQDEIKRSLKAAIKDEEDEDGFLNLKTKSKTEKVILLNDYKMQYIVVFNIHFRHNGL
jgi:hypothetical protein